jgi:UDP-N-acetylmuramoyl-L-alanyl-D-glutamate--2,6-diaminopimelate ligase
MMPAMKQQYGVKLHALLDGLIDASSLSPVADVAVDGIAQDSRNLGENYLFIAIPGTASHGLDFVEQAAASGASVVLWDGADSDLVKKVDALSDKITCVQVAGLQQKTSEIAARFFNHPSRDLNMIGVTGTDGKTSVSHYIAQCLDSRLSPCGVLGTLGNGLIHDLKPTGLTTASAVDVQHSLANLVAAGAGAAVMEVSSHGLDQGRVSSVHFDTAVFTNLSQDHLDYHGTMESYSEAKSKLFETKGLKSAVINLDDDFGRIIAEKYRAQLTVYGYSTTADTGVLESCADFIVYAKSMKATKRGFEINVATPKGNGYFELELMGSFNVSNALAVLATLLLNNVAFDESIRRLQAITPVAGRMELIVADNKPAVIVDYAHTPQGIAAACNAVKQHFGAGLWCVFGCGGDRDREKRPLMAQAVERYADHIVVTSDNPRHEDPQLIIEQIVNGLAEPDAAVTYVDRRQAIAHAVAHATPDDVILIAGKGHESCQIVGDKYIVFDDRDVARALLDARGTGVNG